ncbi:hypothetical protein BU25DRAFT_199846 [Macroventuria anomochaeta]|uniref:Uncharacterized protein n=1 Tax=Macroventuria anomochaeta TaxID=301207 RepID=A0ACB6RMN6_9PLEO|nr:uncharacterized protein BU25DRAFT_199846 [Macroventuria anomochaeta]KAF2622993.1 hypothetical protein BU25DRAFT_199846 [Macroventuria anomochaeta]
MLEQSLGISRSVFSKHVVPAYEDDKFMNDKCMWCWDSYNNEHPAARTLPCSYVFGQDCIQFTRTNGRHHEIFGSLPVPSRRHSILDITATVINARAELTFLACKLVMKLVGDPKDLAAGTKHLASFHRVDCSSLKIDGYCCELSRSTNLRTSLSTL